MSAVKIDTANKIYARIVEIFTIAGLVIMILGLVLYITGALPAYVKLTDIVKNWNKNTEKFWKSVKGIVPKDYSWILGNLDKADIISVLGVILLPIGVIIAVLCSLAVYAKRFDRILVMAIVVAIIMILAAAGPYIGLRVHH